MKFFSGKRFKDSNKANLLEQDCCGRTMLHKKTTMEESLMAVCGEDEWLHWILNIFRSSKCSLVNTGVHLFDFLWFIYPDGIS